jgi:uncharacterized protein YndB with AHSA1/START domain
MRPTSTTFSAPIAAPLEKVFTLLSNPLAYSSWLPGCQAANTLGAVKKGSRISITFGVDRSTILEIVDFNPPSSIGWADRGDRRGSRTFFQLYFAGGATTLSMKDVWEPKRLTDLVKGRIFKRRDAKRFFDSVVNNLRKAVTK